MRMHVLSGGRLQMKRNVYYPDADRSETVDIPVSCFLLRHPQGNVLFDTGCHPTVASDPEARWGGLAKFMVPKMGPGDNVVSELKCLGVEPHDIDVVVCSHLHTDHCGCNAFFEKATTIVHRRELETAQDPASEGKGYFRQDWEESSRLEAIQAERDLFGDGRVVLVPVPGHSPGTTAALVNLDRSGSFLLASDAVSVKASLDKDYAPKNTWNAELLSRSMAEIRRIQAGGATVICGHDVEQWATLKKGADAYD